MNCSDDDLSPHYISSYHDGPYNSSLASSASSSSASVWSDAASQSSDDSSVHSTGSLSDSDFSESYFCSSRAAYQTSKSDSARGAIVSSSSWPKRILASVAPEQRQHARRTSVCAIARSGCPPALVRQCDRKVNFVDSLVDSSAQIVEAIWPLSSIVCRSDIGHKGVLPLRTFIQETLRRSRTSYSTLQVALYYLILIKPHIPKHDFTMEQPEDAHSFRALQCGRRMFLSALILASKYLQDRNYSARAWSKISGLNTQEINQNEIAFLLAVSWRIHITDDVFQRWTDIVLKYTPSQPPSPGALSVRCAEEQVEDWKYIVLGLNPELDNIDDISPSASSKTDVKRVKASLKPSIESSYSFENSSNESTPTPRYYSPNVMEPSASSAYTPIKVAPALGLLPTPRLTPQIVGYSTPAVTVASYTLGRPSMGYAMAQATSTCAAQSNERWATTSSPQGFPFARRSSLANSVSSMSSPESMISDSSSRSSRSSSISSASSAMCAPFSSKLDVQARCRYAKQCTERKNRAVFAAVPEGYADIAPTSSPESYTSLAGKDFIDLSRDLSLDTPLACDDREADYLSRDSINDAARALQDLHNHALAHSTPRLSLSRGSKRSRPQSIDNSVSLQNNVRDMLTSQYHADGGELGWSDNILRARPSSRSIYESGSVSVSSVPRGAHGRKRVCCSTEASNAFPHSDLLARPGMWEGILN